MQTQKDGVHQTMRRVSSITQRDYVSYFSQAFVHRILYALINTALLRSTAAWSNNTALNVHVNFMR